MVTWREFKDQVREYMPQSTAFASAEDISHSRMLFRGQADSNWAIQSTLERGGYPEMSLDVYMRKCAAVRRIISNHVESHIPFDENANCSYEMAHMRLPNYAFLAYLRHHGFLSPMLDWSESPYVAAFFAFQEIEHGTKTVRIIGYRKRDGSMCESYSAGDPCLFVLGPFEGIDKRHASQQCNYTVSMKQSGNQCVFAPHECAIIERSNQNIDDGEDVFRYWDLSVNERDAVLADLFSMNITPFTLFHTVDSLVATAKWRLFGTGSDLSIRN
jgi:hypothetical protein